MVSLSERPLQVLVVDSDPEVAGRVHVALADGGRGDGEWRILEADTMSGALEIMSLGSVDVAVLNLQLPDSEGIVTFERMYAFAPEVPILAFGQDVDEETALLAVRGGAQDFLDLRDLESPGFRRTLRYALERHRLMSALRSLSLIDELTGLYNRRGFMDLGSQYLKLGRRSGRGAGLIFLDIDRFKTINDTLGHNVGDRALVRAADVLRQAFRRSDLIARMGGDEFAVLAQESWDTPEHLEQRVRDAFSSFNSSTREPYQLSVSVGAARTDGEERMRLEDLLEFADSAMYEEKRGKRNVAAS